MKKNNSRVELVEKNMKQSQSHNGGSLVLTHSMPVSEQVPVQVESGDYSDGEEGFADSIDIEVDDNSSDKGNSIDRLNDSDLKSFYAKAKNLIRYQRDYQALESKYKRLKKEHSDLLLQNNELILIQQKYPPRSYLEEALKELEKSHEQLNRNHTAMQKINNNLEKSLSELKKNYQTLECSAYIDSAKIESLRQKDWYHRQTQQSQQQVITALQQENSQQKAKLDELTACIAIMPQAPKPPVAVDHQTVLTPSSHVYPPAIALSYLLPALAPASGVSIARQAQPLAATIVKPPKLPHASHRVI